MCVLRGKEGSGRKERGVKEEYVSLENTKKWEKGKKTERSVCIGRKNNWEEGKE